MSLATAAVRTAATYSVEIDTEAFLAMTRAEWKDQIPYEETLISRLEGISPIHAEREVEGVYGVEYDAHFGAQVVYSVDAEDDTPELHAKVMEIITDQLTRARDLRTAAVA